MSKFFFDLQDDGNLLRDEDGLELSDAVRAELHARQIAFDIARDLAVENRRVKIFVRDENGSVLEVEVGAEVRTNRVG